MGRNENCSGDSFYSLTAQNNSRATPFEDFINTALNYLNLCENMNIFFFTDEDIDPGICTSSGVWNIRADVYAWKCFRYWPG
jgi:hypothetical protein